MGSVVDRVEEIFCEETEHHRFVTRIPGQPGFLSTLSACDPCDNRLSFVDPSGEGIVVVYRSETQCSQCAYCHAEVGSLHCIITRNRTVCLYCYYEQRTGFLSRYLMVIGSVCQAMATGSDEGNQVWCDFRQCLLPHIANVLIASLDADVLINSFDQRYPTKYTPPYVLSRPPPSLLSLVRHRLHRRCSGERFSLIDPELGAGLVCVPDLCRIYRCYKSKRDQFLWTFHREKYQQLAYEYNWPSFIYQIQAFTRRFPRYERLDYCVVQGVSTYKES